MLDLPYLPLMEGTDDEAKALSRRIVFHHGPLTWESQTAEDLRDDNVCRPYLDGRVILIVRHPLDCLVSLFMQVRHRSGYSHAGSLSTLNDFLASPIFGLEKFIKFHNLWARHLPCENIHLLKYEDLRRRPVEEARALLTFLELPVENLFLTDALRFSSFENMQKLEANSSLTYRSSGLNIFATGDRANPDAFHVRSGKIGEYKSRLTDQEVAAQEGILKKLDPIFGYFDTQGSHFSIR